MHIICVRNVAEGLSYGLRYLEKYGVQENTRNGPALVAPGPVITEYSHPREFVLNNPVRDANPFFHLLEAFWLLSGRNDTPFLDNYIKTFGERFAENGILHGSYGRRWRFEFGEDQLLLTINKLKSNPETRQAVVQHWHAPLDIIGEWKDRPCNTHIYFMVRNGRLDMTVCNRSNDIIYGAYGANAVQFGVLLTYIANMVNIPTGRYFQFSNNYHAYVTDLDKMRARGEIRTTAYPGNCCERIVFNRETFDAELGAVMGLIEQLNNKGPLDCPKMTNRYLSDTVFRAALAHYYYRSGKHSEAYLIADMISAEDWKIACCDWLVRREPGHTATALRGSGDE